MAIGWASGCTWLTGDCNKNIRPSAGVVDCTASTGTAGQILSSTGTAIAWRSGCVQQTASCTANVTLAAEITTRKLNNGDSLTVYNSNAAVPPVAITLTATTLTNSSTYPTQATATVFTLPPQGSVTLILADAATNAWYIESYDTPKYAGQTKSGIVNAGACVCMDNFAFSMAASGNRSFGFNTLSGTATPVTWSNCGTQNGYTSGGTFQNRTITTAFQRFDNGYNYGFHGATQSTTICVGFPTTAAYQVLGIVGCGYNNNIICVTRIV